MENQRSRRMTKPHGGMIHWNHEGGGMETMKDEGGGIPLGF